MPNAIAEVDVGNTVAEDTSDGDALKGFKDYEDFISVIETAGNRFRLAAAQSSTLNNALHYLLQKTSLDWELNVNIM